MEIIIVVIILGVLLYFFKDIIGGRKWKKPKNEISESDRTFLELNVAFYQRLSSSDKLVFEYEVQEFLLNYKITPVKTNITREDKLLIAASGVIPIFAFSDWKYFNLKEILIYPDSFNLKFEIQGDDRWVAGVVGNGALGSKMILSKKAIVNGFASDDDGHNTALHEFIHLLDGADGDIDGIPQALLSKPYVLPWLRLIDVEMDKIHKGNSVLRDYGGTNTAEFLSVASEYFFERPDELAQEHPELYNILAEMFSKKRNNL